MNDIQKAELIEKLIESLSDAIVQLAKDGILNYHAKILSADCIDVDDWGDGTYCADLCAVLPLVFKPVEGWSFEHAEIAGVVSLGGCTIQTNEGEVAPEKKQTLIWNSHLDHQVVMNFGYRSYNIVWATSRDMNKPDEYNADGYKDWKTAEDDIGLTYEDDCHMGFEVAQRAIGKMSEPLRMKFFNELVEVANREYLVHSDCGA